MTSEEVKYSLDRAKPKHATGSNRLVNQSQGITETFPTWTIWEKKKKKRIEDIFTELRKEIT